MKCPKTPYGRARLWQSEGAKNVWVSLNMKSSLTIVARRWSREPRAPRAVPERKSFALKRLEPTSSSQSARGARASRAARVS